MKKAIAFFRLLSIFSILFALVLVTSIQAAESLSQLEEAREEARDARLELLRPQLSFSPGTGQVYFIETIDDEIALELQRQIEALGNNYLNSRARLLTRLQNYVRITGQAEHEYEIIDVEVYNELRRRMILLETNYDEARTVLHERQWANENVISINADEFEVWIEEMLESLKESGVFEEEVEAYRRRYTNVLGDIRGNSYDFHNQRAATLSRLQRELPDELFFFNPINDYITRDERIALFEANLSMSNDIQAIWEFLNDFRERQ